VAVEYGGLDAVDGIVVLGLYGLDRWTAAEPGAPRSAAREAGLDVVRSELPALIAELPLPPGVQIEDKGASVAVHTRRSADPDGALDLLRGPLADLAGRTGLVVEPGRLVLELRPEGMDKGKALEQLVDTDRPSSVLYAGDDLGDLAAYDAVDRLRAAGIPGLLVCSGSVEVAALAARSDLVVEGPAGVVDLLGELADALDGGAPVRER
jgi:trehalose 6-phosphate phosphatase